ncbi:MAG: hypothetical protein COT81_05150 [Candidatus Buchananbacteria bacterium CG10_big_fil_rev_8_21_14_0_10_42_9]|uniref:SRPBCC family protein n=1 Tax=Candidatus Buchananbacteria bacterium CG10_big_fil_rev_8_21_14_0_10_42_9 TaxID=1974526 RepID=A0A2H0W001_9BACT|nr:MAG: hypothetical protein COT81_05150 [Candidatus Buchananbacteria bacterium CG10_big_fil_rev_8_21_14_0_10_42_9]
MLVKIHTEININNTPEAIAEYAANPDNWTASNPKEHLGLKFYNDKNRPETGVEFYQKEMVAGIYNDLKGHVQYVDFPHVTVWRGLAKYRLLGPLVTFHLAEGGLVRLKEYESGTKMMHDYYIDFPDSVIGRILHWYFTKKNVKEKLFIHGNNELQFFKKVLDNK